MKKGTARIMIERWRDNMGGLIDRIYRTRITVSLLLIPLISTAYATTSAAADSYQYGYFEVTRVLSTIGAL